MNCCILDSNNRSSIICSKKTLATRELTPQTGSSKPMTCPSPTSSPRPYLQQLPDELLLQIINYMLFRGLRALLHSRSARLARLAKFRLIELQEEFRSWPGATEKTKFFWHKPDVVPWPPIEVAGSMFLGKEFCLVDRGDRDEFVSATECGLW